MNSIPRFLLPRGRHFLISKPYLVPRRHLTSVHPQCHPSTPPPTKTNVLAKPTKYVPPSHPTGDRRQPSSTPLPRKPHIPSRKRYPGTLPERGTIHHFLLHSRALHGITTITLLLGLTLYVSIHNFVENDPAAQAVFWEWMHPIASIKSFIVAYRESDKLNTARIMAKRKKLSEDIEKKAHYRYVVEGKTGSEEEGFGGWALRRSPKDEELGWGVTVNGQRIDELIAEREQKRKMEAAKKELEEAGLRLSASGVVTGTQVAELANTKEDKIPITASTEGEQLTPEQVKKKTSFFWW